MVGTLLGDRLLHLMQAIRQRHDLPVYDLASRFRIANPFGVAMRF
jgi:hypothetical protein